MGGLGESFAATTNAGDALSTLFISYKLVLFMLDLVGAV